MSKVPLVLGKVVLPAQWGSFPPMVNQQVVAAQVVALEKRVKALEQLVQQIAEEQIAQLKREKKKRRTRRG